jgi:hypothetical protein
MKQAVEELKIGIRVDGFLMQAGKITPGRFAEEENAEVHLKRGDFEAYLLTAKVFHGRGKHLRPWVELFNINRPVEIGGEPGRFFGSVLEEALLKLFSAHIPPGGSIFVEYYGDPETARCLSLGFPPPVTRLGFRLFELGFTWFKDWYFCEGYLEGGQKLQADRPMDEAARNRHMKNIEVEAKEFLSKMPRPEKAEEFEKKAAERARRILSL